MPRRFLRAILALLLPLITGIALGALAAPAGAQAPNQDPQLDPTTAKALEQLADQIASKRVEYQAAVTNAITERAAELRTELDKLSWQFASLSTRVDVQEFEAPNQSKFDLQGELESLVRPLLQAIKDATAEPRLVADLKGRIETLTERRMFAEEARRAATRTRNLLAEGSGARAEAEREIAERWDPTVDNLNGQILILEARLINREESQKSVLQGIQDTTGNFLANSGLNLLLCGLVFSVVFFGLRWFQTRVLSRRTKERAVSLRLFEVLLGALSLLLAIGATLVVPYVRNDWLLLAIGIVFLIGAGWVLIRMLPQFVEQIRLVLNIGAVREGERLVVDGLPYRVESLRFQTRLVNPDLQGGTLRMPIQNLIGRRSRISDAAEPWFPCRKGDVVMLEDDVIGPVETQTPELVVVLDYRAPRTYPAAAFLAEKPRNLSRGFSVITTFGVDYRHQSEATTKIPATLTAALQEHLALVVPPEQIEGVQVQFQAAGQSSLDYLARADFTGAAAEKYRELRRALQRILVDTCTQHGWQIPFAQLTLHRPQR